MLSGVFTSDSSRLRAVTVTSCSSFDEETDVSAALGAEEKHAANCVSSTAVSAVLLFGSVPPQLRIRIAGRSQVSVHVLALTLAPNTSCGYIVREREMTILWNHNRCALSML